MITVNRTSRRGGGDLTNGDVVGGGGHRPPPMGTYFGVLAVDFGILEWCVFIGCFFLGILQISIIAPPPSAFSRRRPAAVWSQFQRGFRAAGELRGKWKPTLLYRFLCDSQPETLSRGMVGEGQCMTEIGWLRYRDPSGGGGEYFIYRLPHPHSPKIRFIFYLFF